MYCTYTNYTVHYTIGVDTKDGNFQMYSNFTSGIEYYYNVNANTCDLYGLNYWSDWCYGKANQQTWMSSVRYGNQLGDVWGQEGTPFTWTNARGNCVPVSMVRPDTGESTFFYNMREGAPKKGFFDLPAACVTKAAEFESTKTPLPPTTRKTLF